MLDDLLFSVVHGNPTDEEVAALVAALLAARPAPEPPFRVPSSAWARSARPRGGREPWHWGALPR